MLLRCAAPFLLVLAVLPPVAGQKTPPKAPPLRPIAPLDVAAALDAYAAGRFDAAVKRWRPPATRSAGTCAATGRSRAATGSDADPEHQAHRLLAAASLALETEHLRAERGDWRTSDNPLCAAACVLDWAQLQLVARGAPDRAERAWYLAAAALAGGVRDWRYLQRPADATRPPRYTAGLIDRALVRFPGDAALRLEEGIAAAGRFNLIVDAPAGSRRNLAGVSILAGRGLLPPPRRADDAQESAARHARVTRRATRRWERKRACASATCGGPSSVTTRRKRNWRPPQRGPPAPTFATSPSSCLARIGIARGDSAGAIGHLEAALRARPGSQSAAVALAALELQRGDAVKADEIARDSLARQDVDPWRLFLYGHHPRWPALAAALRREVTR